MTTTGFDSFDITVEQSNIWLKDLMDEMGVDDRHKAYLGLRLVLHALRDRLLVNEAVHLSAEMPMLLRGLYFEGWEPAKAPIKRDREAFMSYVSNGFRNDPAVDPETVIRAVFSVISMHVSEGEVADVKNSLPEQLRRLWPEGGLKARRVS
jgi:uncharacterized protein (DUF2267 family)